MSICLTTPASPPSFPPISLPKPRSLNGGHNRRNPSSASWAASIGASIFPCCRHCAALQEFTFVLAGTRLAAFERPIKALEVLPNVIIPGRVSIEDGRYLLHHMTVGLIPYPPCQMNDCINPVKLYAHALLGKPTVGTAIRELVLRPEVVRTGSTVEEMVAAIRAAVARAADAAQVRTLKEFAFNNTWKQRAAAAAEQLSLIPRQPAARPALAMA